MNIYQQNGFNDRQKYLESLAEDYGDIVWALITILPESEDFDGLIASLEDHIE